MLILTILQFTILIFISSCFVTRVVYFILIKISCASNKLNFDQVIVCFIFFFFFVNKNRLDNYAIAIYTIEERKMKEFYFQRKTFSRTKTKKIIKTKLVDSMESVR